MPGRVRTIHQRFRRVLLFSVLLLAGVAVFVGLRDRKEWLQRKSALFLETFLSRETKFNIHIGKISGDLLGYIRLEEVRIEDPALPKEEALLFTAKEARFRYQLRDLITKRYEPTFELYFREASVFFRPTAGVRRRQLPLWGWLRQMAGPDRRDVKVLMEGLELVSPALTISGIDASFKDDSFEIEVPLRHVNIAGSDVSSTLKVTGRFDREVFGRSEQASGTLRTEGTIVNWKPLEFESEVHYEISRDGMTLASSDFLGGVAMTGSVDFEKSDELQFDLKTENYPLDRLAAFFRSGGLALPGRVDLEAKLRGYFFAPHTEARLRIHDGWVEGHAFKTMDVQLQGIYPTLLLTDSRILMHDGSMMRLADRAMEVSELLRGEGFRSLVSGVQQESVSWGNWEFKRLKDINDEPEFLMERHLGDRASLQLRRSNEEEAIDQSEPSEMGVGFEYRLTKEALKFEVKEDESFLGIERKMQF